MSDHGAEGAPQTDIEGAVRQLDRMVGGLFRRMAQVESASFRAADQHEVEESFERLGATIADLVQRVGNLTACESSNATSRLDDVMGLERRIGRIERAIFDMAGGPNRIENLETAVFNTEDPREARLKAVEEKLEGIHPSGIPVGYTLVKNEVYDQMQRIEDAAYDMQRDFASSPGKPAPAVEHVLAQLGPVWRRSKPFPESKFPKLYVPPDGYTLTRNDVFNQMKAIDRAARWFSDRWREAGWMADETAEAAQSLASAIKSPPNSSSDSVTMMVRHADGNRRPVTVTPALVEKWQTIARRAGDLNRMLDPFDLGVEVSDARRNLEQALLP